MFCPEGPAADLFADAGAIVHKGDVSIFAHAWDSPYEGLRWLVLGREIASLPPHLRQLDRLMRTHRFPLVHLNDSPLLAAAWVAHSHGAKIVWHLRSALAGEGRDRRSRLIASFMETYGDAAIAIDRDVAARFPIRLPLEIVHNSVRPPEPSIEGGKAALGLPEDRVAIGFAGFVRRQKGWQELVSAAEILVSEGAPAHFVIMGGGVRPPEYFKTMRGRALALTNLLTDEESAIKDLVAEKGLDDHFSFLPFTAETGEIYSALDIVTFPNQGVGLGRPVLEAATYGKPVVASGSAGGAGVLLPGKTGPAARGREPGAARRGAAAPDRRPRAPPPARRGRRRARAREVRPGRQRARRRARLRPAARPRDRRAGTRAAARGAHRGMTGERPLVSIVTPSLNQGRFLREAIESVQAQTYEPVEHIVVDGGSTDEHARDPPAATSRSRWVSEPDRGQSHALNKGFATARGEILGWLNADDHYLPERRRRGRARARRDRRRARLRRRDPRERRRRQPAPDPLAADVGPLDGAERGLRHLLARRCSSRARRSRPSAGSTRASTSRWTTTSGCGSASGSRCATSTRSGRSSASTTTRRRCRSTTSSGRSA